MALQLKCTVWAMASTGTVPAQRHLSLCSHRRLADANTRALSPSRPGSIRRPSAPKRGNPPRSGNGFSSRFRGVIHHRRSQRFEAHIWSEGKQTYLGGFDTEYEAAVAYDLAAVKFRGQGAIANFPVENYKAELSNLDSVSSPFKDTLIGGARASKQPLLQCPPIVSVDVSPVWHPSAPPDLQSALQISRDDLVQQLRNQGKGGQTKTSRYRGVMKHAKGKWEARLGQSCGSKYQYLGLFGTEIDAAVAYDRAAISQSLLEAEPNFSFENYADLLGAPRMPLLCGARSGRPLAGRG